MGRTFEALSHRTAILAGEDEGTIPPTQIIPVFPDLDSPETPLESEVDQASKDTALDDEPLADNDQVPFIEVGGTPGKKTQIAMSLTLTPVPNPAPLKLAAPPKPAANGRLQVAFYPLPERPVNSEDGKRIAPELIAYHSPDDPLSALYRSVQAGIAQQQTRTDCPLLVFTPIGNEELAAIAVLNLAVTRAREENRRILVIEANHERPRIADRLGIASLPGLRELLNRGIPLSAALHRTAQKNLFALPPGDSNVPVPHEAEERLPQVLNHLRKRFDWIVVNAPEWGNGGATEWAGLGDGVYLVVRQEQWESTQIEAAHEAMILDSIKLRGYLTLDMTA
jgi:Mrp family chromosome partitioning ATPase